MVEFALVLPILLILALGIVDFGRAINYWNDTNQIAADAARFAAVNRNPGDDLATPQTDFLLWIRSQAETGELREGQTAVGPSESVTSPLKVCVLPVNGEGTLNVGDPIKVTVDSNYNLIPFLSNLGEDTVGSIDIHGEAVMRLEQKYTQETGCTA